MTVFLKEFCAKVQSEEKKCQQMTPKAGKLPSMQRVNVHIIFVDVEDPEIFEGLLNDEKENFKVLFEKVCYEGIDARKFVC